MVGNCLIQFRFWLMKRSYNTLARPLSGLRHKVYTSGKREYFLLARHKAGKFYCPDFEVKNLADLC